MYILHSDFLMFLHMDFLMFLLYMFFLMFILQTDFRIFILYSDILMCISLGISHNIYWSNCEVAHRAWHFTRPLKITPTRRVIYVRPVRAAHESAKALTQDF